VSGDDGVDFALGIALALHERSLVTTDELLRQGDEYGRLLHELRERITDYAAECDSRAVALDLLHILNTLGRTDSPTAY
jgi:hypothetical protein